jgi:hypothetical protein
VDWFGERDVRKMVMMTRIMAEIISSVLCRRLRVGEGGRSGSESGFGGSGCSGRAMSKVVWCVWLRWFVLLNELQESGGAILM